jgi:hypothetical protein
MKGSKTKNRKTGGRISWVYYYKAEAVNTTSPVSPRKFDASRALGAALTKHQDVRGSRKAILHIGGISSLLA